MCGMWPVCVHETSSGAPVESEMGMPAGLRLCASEAPLTSLEGFDAEALRKYCGHVLRTARRARHLSQADIARELGTTRTTICRLEQGQYGGYLERALPYAHLLDVPYMYLFPPHDCTPMSRRIRRMLTAPSYVQALFDSILDLPQQGCPAAQLDVS
jgi:DNA-binding XRE family transcriptional regulator